MTFSSCRLCLDAVHSRERTWLCGWNLSLLLSDLRRKALPAGLLCWLSTGSIQVRQGWIPCLRNILRLLCYYDARTVRPLGPKHGGLPELRRCRVASLIQNAPLPQGFLVSINIPSPSSGPPVHEMQTTRPDTVKVCATSTQYPNSPKAQRLVPCDCNLPQELDIILLEIFCQLEAVPHATKWDPCSAVVTGC